MLSIAVASSSQAQAVPARQLTHELGSTSSSELALTPPHAALTRCAQLREKLTLQVRRPDGPRVRRSLVWQHVRAPPRVSLELFTMAVNAMVDRAQG